MAKVIDPRAIAAFEEFLLATGLHGWDLKWRKLPKRQHEEAWAKVRPFPHNKEAELWVGPTVGLPDVEVRKVMAHEVGHIHESLLKGSTPGDTTSEQFCNMFSALLVPDGPRSMRHRGNDTFEFAATMAKHYFDDDERDALTEAMPHLILRLAPQHREVLCAVFYDGKSLAEIAEDMGIPRTGGSGVQARRDAALKALRAAFLAEGGETTNG